MRTFEEIMTDIKEATSRDDAAQLQVLADEMSAIGTDEAEASASNTRGTAYRLTGDFANALVNIDKALSLFQMLKDREGMAAATGTQGSAFFSMGRYPEAIDAFHRSLVLFEELGHRYGVAVFTGNIANVYYKTGAYEDAIATYRRALDIYQELGDRLGEARIVGNMGNVYVGTGNYAEALIHYHRAVAMNEELGNRYAMAQFIGNMGIVYRNTGSYPEALEYSFRARALYEETGNQDGIASINTSIGNIYAASGSHAEALDYLKMALDQSEALGDIHLMAVVTSNLGSRMGDAGDHEAAVEHYRRARILYEQVGDQAGVERVAGHCAYGLLQLDRVAEAVAQLDELASMTLQDPRVRASYHSTRGDIAELQGDVTMAYQEITKALHVATEFGLRSQMVEYHLRLRDLAQKMNDFAAYIDHNTEYGRIREEIHGKESTQKMAVMESQRKMDAELRERDKERAILYSTLPSHVADRLVRGEDVSGDHFDHASVLFLDVVGFTTNANDLEPRVVTELLDVVFNTFDDLCEKHNVTKIKTIGDAYLAVAFPLDDQSTEQNIASVALAIQQLQFTWPNASPLQFRVGLHSGPIVAGVIGKQRLQYDVWGDTVNVASRMESTSEPLRIHVSEAFADALRTSPDHSAYTLTQRGVVEIKGKGAMNTYWLEGER